MQTINTHENHRFIENIFFEQMKKHSLRQLSSFDYQFSDLWLN